MFYSSLLSDNVLRHHVCCLALSRFNKLNTLKIMVHRPGEILKALENRLTEINQEQCAQVATFSADPEHHDVPTHSPERLEELDSIHAAIAREWRGIESQKPPTLPPNFQPEVTRSGFGLEQPYTSALRTTQTGHFAGGRPTTLVRDAAATSAPSTTISATAHGTTVRRGVHTGYNNTTTPKMALSEPLSTKFMSDVKGPDESFAKFDLRDIKVRGGCVSCAKNA